MHPEEQLKADLVRVARSLHSRAWVANHDGNATVRLGIDRFLATPTAVSKGDVVSEWLIEVDGTGAVVAGTRKGFSELKLHLAAYRAREDVAAVLHAHPPTATGFAVAGVDLGEAFLAEPVVSLGACVPLVSFGMPGSEALEGELTRALGQADAVLLANHGVLTVGPDLDTCLLRMELVEHMAKIALVAHQLGGAKALPPAVTRELAAKHARLFPRTLKTGAVPTSAVPRGAAADLVADALKRIV